MFGSCLIFTGNFFVSDTAASKKKASCSLALVCALMVFGATAQATAAPCTPTGANRTVTVCTPADGATVTSPLEVSAAAADSAAVTAMQIYLDNTLVFQANASSFDTTITAPVGAHRLTVKAWDNAGSFSQVVNVTVSSAGNTPPFGWLDYAKNAADGTTTVPQGGTLAIVGWAADQQDGAPVAKVQILIDGSLVGNAVLGDSRPDVASAFNNSAYTNSGWHLNFTVPTSLAAGSHTVTAVAFDSAGASTTLPVGQNNTFTVTTTTGNTPPFGWLDYAKNSADGTTTVAQGGTLSIVGWAADQQDGAPVAKVQISIDGSLVGNAVLGDARPDVANAFNNPAYTNSGWHLNFTVPASLAAGSHTVTAVAFDSAGASTTLPVGQNNTFTVTTGNTPPFGWLDYVRNATDGTTTVAAGGSLSFVGWAADQQDGAPVAQVQIFVDGSLVGNAALGDARPDVANAFNNPAYTNSGWHLNWAVPTNFAAGTHTAKAIAFDSAGASTTLPVGQNNTFTVIGTGAGTVSGWLTYKFDNRRTGANDNEIALTPSNVNAIQFGRKLQITVDGLAFAQPLYVRSLQISGAQHNVVFIATEHDSVYAFDADTGAQLWHTSLLVNGATPAPGNTSGRTALGPEVGITGTPVIDPNTGTMYVSAMTVENSVTFHRLHALDITTGAEMAGSPVQITATVAGTGTGSVNGQITFAPDVQNQRAGLALGNGFVYVSFGAFSDQGLYHGWMFAYDAGTLAQTAVWNAAPDGEGSSVWQAGSAPAIDASGNVYAMTGDGHSFNANTGGRNYGDSLVKLSSGGLTPLDFFTPFNQACLDNDDLDLGSGGAMLVPDLQNGLNLLVTGGKEGRIYVVNRDSLGGFHSGSDSQIVQSILINPAPCGAATGFDANSTDRMYSSPAYWNGMVYNASVFTALRAFQFQSGQLVQTSQTQVIFNGSGQSGRAPIPVVSANGLSGGIVWLQNRDVSTGHEILYAFDALNVATELWDSDMNSARDGLATGTVFSVPVVIDGKVISTTGKTINIYGLQ